MQVKIKDLIVAIKGGGDLATGVAWRLFQSNIKKIFIMEVEKPLAVRRQVSFCESIHEGSFVVEGVPAVKTIDTNGVRQAWKKRSIPVMVDPEWNLIKRLKPHVVIDAIIAKKNLGTSCDEAPLVIGLGPGFEAKKDVDIVVETKRGHNLGKVILQGCPATNTGIPGSIKGYSSERLLRSPDNGLFQSDLCIGAIVKKDEIIGHVNGKKVTAQISGILRGLIRNNTKVTKNLKIGDIDPRGILEYCPCISEKALAIAGGVLEGILRQYNI